jgi:hypothetical protein
VSGLILQINHILPVALFYRPSKMGLISLFGWEFNHILSKHYISAFQFAMNVSAIGCSPFEAGHGLPATTLSHARLLADKYHHNHLEGQDGDAIEDGEPTELKGKIKDLVELSIRMIEVTKSTSEWHRRMLSHFASPTHTDKLTQAVPQGQRLGTQQQEAGSETSG